MRIIETKVYTYAELDERGKERARDWYREASAGDNFWADAVEDQFHEALMALGFDIVKRGNDGCKRRDISWSGFGSQGDGAGFGGTWRAADFAPGKLLADRPATYTDKDGKEQRCMSNTRLHEIAAVLESCKKDGLVYGRVTRSNRSHFMSLGAAETFNEAADENEDAPAELANRFIEAARDLARMFYRDLEAEYEYQNADETVAETIEANGYEFTEDGRRYG